MGEAKSGEMCGRPGADGETEALARKGAAREIVVVLHNIRSTYNVGAILRTCDGLGATGAILSGYTPRVHDVGLLPHLREKLDREIHKTALGAEESVKIYSSGDIISDLKEWKKRGFRLVGLENNIKDERLFSICNLEKVGGLGNKVLLILGEEVAGIDYSLYDIIDDFIEIPMRGKKESFNVSVAAGMALLVLANWG